jgi:hypothetical protein
MDSDEEASRYQEFDAFFPEKDGNLGLKVSLDGEWFLCEVILPDHPGVELLHTSNYDWSQSSVVS